jgi:hypothetical protein
MWFHGILEDVILSILARTNSMAFPVQSSRKLISFEMRYLAKISHLIFLGITCADIFPNPM